MWGFGGGVLNLGSWDPMMWDLVGCPLFEVLRPQNLGFGGGGGPKFGVLGPQNVGLRGGVPKCGVLGSNHVGFVGGSLNLRS